MIAVLIVVALLVVALGCGLAYINLFRRRNRTKEAWSQIDVELTRLHSLIPNLVQTVKGYTTHDRGTLEAVTAARTAALLAGASADPGSVASAESELNRSLRSLFAVAENYPQLQAEEGFRSLQKQLAASADKLEFARLRYNTCAGDYNTALGSFPCTLIASPLGFHAVELYETDAAEREAPAVDFTDVPTPTAS